MVFEFEGAMHRCPEAFLICISEYNHWGHAYVVASNPVGAFAE